MRKKQFSSLYRKTFNFLSYYKISGEEFFMGKKLTHVNGHKRRKPGCTRGPKPVKVKTHRRRTSKK